MIQDEPFVVKGGSLGFSVGVYTFLALIGIAILMFRRSSSLCGKAELGGPQFTKYLTSILFILLWIIYILLSSFEAYGFINPEF